MPLFLFIVGVVMPFSFEKRIAQGQGKLSLYKHIFIRVIILWLFAMIQDELFAFDLNKLRLYSNTLQAIAAGYLISSIVILHFRPRRNILYSADYWLLTGL